MKIGCVIFIAAMLGLLHADIRPDDPGTPLFQIYGMTQQADTPDATNPNGHPLHHFTLGKQPLLTVSSLHDLLLEPDGEGVRVVLNDADATALAQITRQNSMLAFMVSQKLLATVLIRQPIDNGSMMFGNAHYTGAMADYLRGRFHIKTGANMPENHPAASP